MPGEKQTNLYEQLSALEGLRPALEFNEEALWQRLEPRLLQRRKKQKAWWIVAVAAVVVGLLLLRQSMVSVPQSAPVTQEATVQQPIAPKQPSLLQQPLSPAAQVAAGKGKAAKRLPMVTPLKSLQPKHQAMLPLSIVYETASVPVPVAINTPSFSIAAPSQKRFRIAHINELNTSPTITEVQPTQPPRKPMLATVSEVTTPNEKATVQLRKQGRALSLNASQ